jgi:hypothetical protein
MGAEPRFVVRTDGRLDPVTASRTPEPQEGDTLVVLGSVPLRQAGEQHDGAALSADGATAGPLASRGRSSASGDAHDRGRPHDPQGRRGAATTGAEEVEWRV